MPGNDEITTVTVPPDEGRSAADVVFIEELDRWDTANFKAFAREMDRETAKAVARIQNRPPDPVNLKTLDCWRIEPR